MHRVTSSLAGALLATGIPAQLTIADANMSATVGPAPAVLHAPRTFDLFGDALAIDQGFEHWWYFRPAGGTRESGLAEVGGTSSGVTANGNHADMDFVDSDVHNQLKISLDLDVYSAGPASGVVMSRLTVMNGSNAPITVDLFAYTDIDVAGSASNDVCTGTATSHFVSDTSGVQIEVRGVDADRSEVAAYPALRDRMMDNNLDDLNNVAPPLAGDYTGAFQWTAQQLQPFEERTYLVVIAIDTAAVAVPRVVNYGAGNGSLFQIHASDLPLQDNSQPRSFGVRIKNALPNALYRIVSGLESWTPALFIPGIDLWVFPPSIFAVWGGFTSATGEAAEVFTVPPSPYLTGIEVYHQGFYVDAAAPNGFAFWTPGMLTQIGKL
jgi:hypothetical protein